MSVAITSAGWLAGFAVVVASIALVGSALAWRSLRRSKEGEHEHGPVIDLAYLERAIKADEDATARRDAEERPLFSESPAAQPHRHHPLPTSE